MTGRAAPAFVCDPGADLYRVAADACGAAPARFDTFDDAVGNVPPGSGLLVLSDVEPVELAPAGLRAAEEAGLRLYLEQPARLPGLDFAAARPAAGERAVVAGEFFGRDLPAGRILAIHGLELRDLAPHTDTGARHLLAARVAGFDHAVYGVPDSAAPLLFEHPEHPWLVAATRLSGFVTGRAAPADAWAALWRAILSWVSGTPAQPLRWQPLVAAAHRPDAPLPAAAEAETLAAGLAFYRHSGLLVRPDQEPRLTELAETNHAPWPAGPPGDGRHGLLEGRMSILQPDGSQWVSVIRRSDCMCEAGLALALGGDPGTAANLLDFVHHTSAARRGGRDDPAHPAFGHIAWGITNEAWLKAHYGDDNARVLLATAGAAGRLGEDRWDEAMALCLLANLRTSSRFGFRPGRIDLDALERDGWQPYFDSDLELLHPHYEAYLWACFLWAYALSGEALFYERAREAIRRTVEAGPARWHWTNGLAQERARMLLPLAWLVRVADTPEHRRWLADVAAGVLELQEDCGALREQLGAPELGKYPPPASNEAYGEHEAPLIQADGDPVADLLYTTNFAFLGLHEAAAATGDGRYAEAADGLAGFLCRCQARSTARPELDGAWFRAFDLDRWEAWGSNADAGWGAWSVESGWTQGWICTVLALRRDGTSLWELAAGAQGVGEQLRRWRPQMIPEEILRRVSRTGAVDRL